MKSFKEIMGMKQSELTIGDGLKVSLVISGLCMLPALVMAAKELYDDYEWKKSLKKTNEVIEDKED